MLPFLTFKMDLIIKQFAKGVHNLLDAENIPTDASCDSKNWITTDGKLRLVNGRKIIGQEGDVGAIRGLHFGYKVNGDKVLYRKTETKIQYYNGTDWIDIITDLTEGEEYSFANYSSLAGSFTFIAGKDGFYKLNNANPESYINLYDAVKNDRGKILIDKGRLIMWDCLNASKTTLKLSWIDSQDGDVYTTITDEATTSLSGTLAFKAGGAKRNCFAVVITLDNTGEVYTDNRNGTLTGDKGGTGTINYITGEYTLTNEGAGKATYQWEDSTNKGLADFTFSAQRKGGEGNIITQDIGGDAILGVEVFEGVYYSLKEQSAYRLDITTGTSDTTYDITFDNNVYRKDIGIPFFRAIISTSTGIIFMNTANPDNPQLTILQRNIYGDNIETFVTFPHFDFSLFDYSECAIETFGKYVAILCKRKGSEYNDTILLGDIREKTMDITAYNGRMLAKDEGNIYIGSPITQSVYQIYNGFDDDGYPIDNYWKSKAERYDKENLKKYKRLRIKGYIDPNQVIEVLESYDDAEYQMVGTIRGDASYVDRSRPQVIGSNMIGEAEIGGSQLTNTYPFYCQLKVKTPKFRTRKRMLKAKSIGHAEIEMMTDWDILIFENKIPKRFRQKQNVSLDGKLTNQ